MRFSSETAGYPRLSYIIPVLLILILSFSSCSPDDGLNVGGILDPGLLRDLQENPVLYFIPVTGHTSPEISEAISGAGIRVPVGKDGTFRAGLGRKSDRVWVSYLVMKEKASGNPVILPVGFRAGTEFLTVLPFQPAENGVDLGVLKKTGDGIESSRNAQDVFGLPLQVLEKTAALDDQHGIFDGLLASYVSGKIIPDRYVSPSFLWKADLKTINDVGTQIGGFSGRPTAFFPEALLDADFNEVPADQYRLFDSGKEILYQGSNPFVSIPEKISIVFNGSDEFLSYVPASFVPMTPEGRTKLPVPGFKANLDSMNRLVSIDIEWWMFDGKTSGSWFRFEDPSILKTVMDMDAVLTIRDADGELSETVPVIPGKSGVIRSGYVWKMPTEQASGTAEKGIGTVDALILQYLLNGIEYRFELKNAPASPEPAKIEPPVKRLPIVRARPVIKPEPDGISAPPVEKPEPVKVAAPEEPVVPVGIKAEPEVPPPPRTRDVSIKVIPEDSLIYLEGSLAGRGTYTAPLVYGTRKIGASRDGYVPFDGEIVVSDESPVVYEYALERIPVTVEITAEPADSEIFLDGSFMGQGGFSGSFMPGTVLQVTARRSGYGEKSMRITAGSSPSGRYGIRLEETLYRVEIACRPDDGEILLDSTSVGIGTYSGLHRRNESLGFTIRHHDYYERKFPVIVQPRETNSYDIRLVPKAVIETIAASSGKIVGLAAAPDGGILSTDWQGNITAVSPDGTIKWKSPTGNDQHENPSIVVSGGTVFVSGVKTLAAFALENGKGIWRKDLAPGSQHVMGRHIVPAGDTILLPKNDSMDVLQSSTGAAVKNIRVPEGFLSTPALYGAMILAANNFGELLALGSGDGSVKWSVATGAVQPVETDVRVHGDLAFFYGRNGTVACVNLTTRKLQWKSDAVIATQSRISQELEFGRDAVYAFSRNSIFGLSSADGTVLFSSSRDAATPPLYVDGVLYYGGLDGSLLKADARTGKNLGEIVLNDVLSCRPVRIFDRIVCGSRSGTIYVLNPEGVQK